MVTDASTDADLFNSSCEATTPGNPMMLIGSPIWMTFVSASLSTGKFSPGTLSSARSRPDIPLGSPATGGLYFTTVALRLVPFGTSTST